MVHGFDEIAQAGKQSERITIAFLALAWFFITLRVWTRTWIIAGFGWDDATMILACWVVVSEATYLIAMMMVKISLGIFFARIVVAPWHLMLIYVTIGVNALSSVSAFFYCVFRCGSNVENYVMQQLKMKCTSRGLDRFVAYQSATFSTLTDLVFVILPIIVLWNANMDRSSKFSVGFILCLAASACICSMIRFQYVDGLTQIDDFFWNATNIAIWSTIECGASIIAGCLATLRPLLKRMFATAGSITKSLRSSNSRSNDSSRQTTNSASLNTHLGSNGRKPERASRDKPTFAEFIAEPGEVIELSNSSDAGDERESQDRILRQDEEPALDFLWPVKVVERRREPERTSPMHPKHKSWSSRYKTSEQGKTVYRHSSAPSSPVS
ncbi:uncharacterized protein M421DRAFT_66014 [Didymella exigua CBS 183.55]|uniref:Rhodopsin domain-containing protein n=1 Tax=Didymella exigua CBS 183.55 TaxID=1150837 RepID=A0A6A5RNS2_9PLEO|nr:uncharacterized protein M421DRAFT_66014 [Didymella exigua CBS 183.55]KAF1927167.1 hypothetical protein M421DRAFT_66014 [Didymella exigua CBS 183.55]